VFVFLIKQKTVPAPPESGTISAVAELATLTKDKL